MAAPIIPDPDDPGHYEWDSEPEPVRPTRWRRLLGWLGKLLLAAFASTIVSVALLRRYLSRLETLTDLFRFWVASEQS